MADAANSEMLDGDGTSSTRERLIVAAIDRFGRDGFDVGLRQIGADAGLSAASVIKRFGSKEQLRAECDERVFATIRRSRREMFGHDSGPLAFLSALGEMENLRPMRAYIVRSLQEGGRYVKEFVDQIVADAEEYFALGVAAGTIRPSRDERARARYVVNNALGGLLLELRVNPPDSPDDFPRHLEEYSFWTMVPALELFTEGMMLDRSWLEAALDHPVARRNTETGSNYPPADHQEDERT